MDELINKLNELLGSFNNSFEVKAKINDEKIVEGLEITELKNDGSEFIENLINMFSQIIESNDEYELIYDTNDGIKIAKKIITVEYK